MICCLVFVVWCAVVFLMQLQILMIITMSLPSGSDIGIFMGISITLGIQWSFCNAHRDWSIHVHPLPAVLM